MQRGAWKEDLEACPRHPKILSHKAVTDCRSDRCLYSIPAYVHASRIVVSPENHSTARLWLTKANFPGVLHIYALPLYPISHFCFNEKIGQREHLKPLYSYFSPLPSTGLSFSLSESRHPSHHSFTHHIETPRASASTEWLQ